MIINLQQHEFAYVYLGVIVMCVVDHNLNILVLISLHVIEFTSLNVLPLASTC